METLLSCFEGWRLQAILFSLCISVDNVIVVMSVGLGVLHRKDSILKSQWELLF